MPAGSWDYSYLLSALAVPMGVFLPAYLLRDRVPGQDALAKWIASCSLVLGLWVCLFYLTSLTGVPQSLVVLIVLVSSLVVVVKTGIRAPRLPALVWSLCAICLLPYVVGYVSSGMLPGCDTAMHGYVTRLVIEQQGVPGTYRPLLPVDRFAGYSAGFHLIAASAAYFQPEWLMAGLSAATAVAHVIAVFGLALLLSLFAPSSTALLVAMVVFWFNRSLQTVVDWGGTPTMLSLGLVLSALALFGYAIRERSQVFAAMGATVWSAATLTHLIPAYTGLYVGMGLIAYWIWKYRPPLLFLLKSAGVSVAVAVACLAPFILNMDDPRSPALSQRIREWQHRMMDDAFTGDLFSDAYRSLMEVKFSLSDLTIISVTACVLWLLSRRRYRTLGFVSGLSLLLFALTMNTGYWLLPFSELLYPERVMYFYVIPCGILTCRTAEELEPLRARTRGLAVPVIAVAVVGVGLHNCFLRYVDALAHPDRRSDAGVMEVFAWIGEHTAPDAVIHVAYDTEGMWVPALSYRAAVGTHLHFIHDVLDVKGQMEKAPVDHYLLRSSGNTTLAAPTDPYAEISEVVFTNGSMELVRTRWHR